jgi:hypothetical protein
MTQKYDPRVCIEPRVFPVSELGNDNPFVKEVQKYGILIPKPKLNIFLVSL